MRLISLLWMAGALCAADHQVVFPVGAKPVGPYSPGILAGEFLYVSGQGARDGAGNLPATEEARVRQTLENVKSIVTAAGLTMEHIVYAQVYLHPSTSYEAMNKVWSEYFPKNPPARATLGVFRMPTETPVEVNAVAIRTLSHKKVISPDWFPNNLNISAAVDAGDRVFLSGFLGRELGTGKVPEEPSTQVNLALDRIGAVLKSVGLDYRHMVFVNPYHTKAIPRKVLDEAYAKRFEFGNTPARATIQVEFLPLGTNIELTGVAVKDLSKRKAYRPKNMPPSATASPCVMAADTLYCSSKAGFIPGVNGGLYAEAVEDQVRQTMRNLLDGLEEAGMDFSHTVASNVYLDTIDEFAKMNGVYAKYFTAKPPSRTTVSPLAPTQRGRLENGQWPKLEEISIVAVR